MDMRLPSPVLHALPLSAAAIILSNVIFVAALSTFRLSGLTGCHQLFLLSLSNLALLVIAAISPKTGSSHPANRAELACILIWSAAYAFNFGLFAVLPKALDVSDLILCESIAPFLSALLCWNGNWRGRSAVILSILSPVALAVPILAMTASGGESRSSTEWILVPLVCAAFVASLSCARFISKTRDASWVCPRLGLANTCLTVTTGLAVLSIQASPNSFDWTRLITPDTAFVALSLAVGMYFAQKFLLIGLRGTSAWISAPLVATTVPASIISDHVLFGETVAMAALILSVGYIAAVLAATWGQHVKSL